MKRIVVAILVLALLAALACALWLRQEFAIAPADSPQIAALLGEEARTPAFVEPERAPCHDINPLHNAYFGELHIHTAVSHDSAAFGNISTPADAYKFAMGQPLALQQRGEAAGDAPVVQLERPLDFAAVTDHAERFAETSLCDTPGTAAYDALICKLFRGDVKLPVEDDYQPLARMFPLTMLKGRPAQLCGEDGLECLHETASVWKQHQRAAEEAYDRSADCTFTSFVAYEFSLARDASNLHRNVIFANATVPPTPLSSIDADTPEALWEWLEHTCTGTDTGCDAVAIPHNSNWSNGQMFYPYAPRDITLSQKKHFARLRNELEPLVEVMQVKGDSECRNGLGGVLGAPDELCDFEKLRLPAERNDCGDIPGSGGMKLMGCLSRWSYARYGLAEGLREEQALGINPMKYGIVAATDNHTAASGAVSEQGFAGSTGIDRTPRGRLREPVETPFAKADPTRFNPGGLAGVWAPENTRDSLFAAMRRKETFGTSGPRIQPRFFAGWNYPADLCEQDDMLEQSYTGGVPMGGDLPVAPGPDAKPTFLASALMDSIEAATPLQKIQIIKGWIDENGAIHQQVIDVAGDARPTIEVDTTNCQQSGSGHRSLCTVWRDEGFEADKPAFYYARVVENPSCRWTTYDCNTLPGDQRPSVCSNPDLPKTIQERAWTSPVWYTPPMAGGGQ